MFQEPKNYTDNDHFFFESDKDLEKVCNAPNTKMVFLKYWNCETEKSTWFLSVTQILVDYLTKL